MCDAFPRKLAQVTGNFEEKDARRYLLFVVRGIERLRVWAGLRTSYQRKQINTIFVSVKQLSTLKLLLVGVAHGDLACRSIKSQRHTANLQNTSHLSLLNELPSSMLNCRHRATIIVTKVINFTDRFCYLNRLK